MNKNYFVCLFNTTGYISFSSSVHYLKNGGVIENEITFMIIKGPELM